MASNPCLYCVSQGLREVVGQDPVEIGWGYMDFSRVNEALKLKLKENDPVN